MMKYILSLLLLCLGINTKSQTVTIYVKAGNIPLQGVTVNYTCEWQASLGNWTTWNTPSAYTNYPFTISVQDFILQRRPKPIMYK